jgi:hypothetical protein
MPDRSAFACCQTWGRAAGGRLATLSRTRPWGVVWALLAACLTGWMLWECLRPLEPRARHEAVAQAGRGLSLPRAPAIAPESLNALYQRVLFKARNQAASNLSVQATAQELLKKLQLRSVSQQGQAWIAYIQVKSEGVKRVAVGDKVAEFSVVQIDRGSVRLRLGSEQVVLGF